ncbi:MAG: CDP-diacylglycerol--serine O-phosphatidyltransferase [Chthoniobacter sp.]|uniref:CDP-diacylglycerol--serine O-phosphatidyltransferase n=1 Tax=Chthoniobacter sp. TaxID=2510640 RepID=UPI0032A8C4AE
MSDPNGPKIYLLPNLMTAGNLFCGFAATLKILEGALIQAAAAPGRNAIAEAAAADKFYIAIWCILASCIFDALDGRLARLGGHESPFGREFDSLADIVSFGVAPALMVYRIVLHEFPNVGWIIASVYLICGALRLARFNCLAAADSAAANKEFRGFPIPAAAGVIASITLCLLWFDKEQREIGQGKWVLPPLMLFLAWMMFSGFKYPSFKAINWRTTRSMPKFIAIVLVILVTVLYYQWMPAVIFITYLLYGFLRPFLSRKMKEEIEEEVEDDDPLESP